MGPQAGLEEHRLVHQLDPILIQGEVARNGRDLAKVFAVGEARNAVLSEVDELKLLTRHLQLLFQRETLVKHGVFDVAGRIFKAFVL